MTYQHRDLDPTWTAETVAVQAGRPARVPGAGVNPPVHLSATYLHDTDLAYGRDGNAVRSARSSPYSRSPWPQRSEVS